MKINDLHFFHIVIVAIGANLSTAAGASALVTCRAAAEALRTVPGLRMTGLSRWYETDPVPPGGPAYVNGIAWLTPEADMPDPAVLLARMNAIEARAGRVRTTQNAPRVLDLDIIAMGALVRDAPDPVLPHPSAHLRGFVLAPLVELAPGWVHPRLGRTAAELLAGLPPQGVRLLC